MNTRPHTTRPVSSRPLKVLLVCGSLAFLAACGSFPSTLQTSQAPQTKSRTNEALLVELPKDVRAQHLGADIAKTGWTACAEDTLLPGEAAPLLQARIAEALAQSAIFQSVSKAPPAQRWTLSSDIRAFCSQKRGFVYYRIAGIVALDFTLKRDGVVVWKAGMERVVTDVDPDYTGSSVALTASQPMQQTMADALRVILRDAVSEIDKAAGSAVGPSASK